MDTLGITGPSERVQAHLRPVVPQILGRAGEHGLVALAVVGSAARGEETWRQGKLVGDIDLAAVTWSPDPFTVRRFHEAARGLGPDIGLGCFPLYSLRRYRTLEFYEAKRTGCVLWGETGVFERVRIESAGDIPRWEGLRLLLNRVMECIRARARLLPPWYAAVKTYLALGEADLVFAGRYAPSYQSRWELLEADGAVLGSRELLERFRWAIQLKLHGDTQPGQINQHEYEHWLLEGLALLLSRYLGEHVTVEAGLAVVSRRIVHPIHRVLYMVRHWRQPRLWAAAVQRDPVFPIWECAIQVLSNTIQLSNRALRALIMDWEQTHQPLQT